MCVANSKKRAPPIEWPAYTTLLPMTTVLDRLTGNTVQHPSALRASRAGRTRPAGGSSASPLSAGRAGARAVCAHRHKRKVRADSGLDVRAHTALCGKQSVLQDNTERLLQHTTEAADAPRLLHSPSVKPILKRLVRIVLGTV
jgi:hypothetical protein